MLTMLIIAQAATEPLSGGAGWVGAGLLGAVLAWLLLVHLPRKDAQLEKFWALHLEHIKDATKSHLEAISAQRSDYVAQQAVLRDEYKAQAALMMAHHEREIAGLSTAMAKEMQALQDAIRELGNMISRKE